MKNFVSLKWKLSIAFCLLSATLVGSYVYFASYTFESDKISYVIDFSELQVENTAKQITQRIDRIVFETRAMLAALDIKEKTFSDLGQKYFKDSSEIRALRVFQGPTLAFEISKPDFTWTESPLTWKKNSENIEIAASDKDHPDLYHLGFYVDASAEQNTEYKIEVALELKDILPKKTGPGILVFNKKEQILSLKALDEIPTDVLDSLLKKTLIGEDNKSTFVRVAEHDYLLSIAKLKYSDLSLVHIEDRASALGALKVLFNRSLIFILLSLFAILFVAVLMSGALTKNLAILTQAAEKVGQGELDHKIEISSRDEVGVLARTFDQMKGQIKNLLAQAEEKARMESELKTASWVQERLFPNRKQHEYKNIRFAGDHLTATECGGDWWYYFQRGDDLFVIIGDATGHGTPAALMTSACRAIFSHLENSDKTLAQMTEEWNRAVNLCSGTKIFMTAQLCQINCITGKYQILNLSHELPFLICKKNETFELGFLELPVMSRLGQSTTPEIKSFEGQLQPGEKMILYTDGLFALTNEKGRALSDRTLINGLSREGLNPELSALGFLEHFFNFLKSYQKNPVLEDDIAILVLENQRHEKSETNKRE